MVGVSPYFYGFTSDCMHDGVLLSHIYPLPMLENENLNSPRPGWECYKEGLTFLNYEFCFD